jgi:hypothetical protein
MKGKGPEKKKERLPDTTAEETIKATMEERSIFAKVDKTKECDQMNESAVSGVFVRAVEEKGMDGMVDVRDG